MVFSCYFSSKDSEVVDVGMSILMAFDIYVSSDHRCGYGPPVLKLGVLNLCL